MIEKRDSVKVILGTDKCLDSSWTMEYNGYLMTGNTCVDKKMEGDDLPIDPNEEPALRHEVATADYQNQKVLSCAVCSK